MDDSGTSLVSVNSGNADISGIVYTSAIGNFHVKFTSSATDGSRGFKIEFSDGKIHTQRRYYTDIHVPYIFFY